MMIILNRPMVFFIQEMKNHDTSRLLNARFEILTITTSFWLIQNRGIIYKTNTAVIRTSPRNFSSNRTNIYANSKIPSTRQL